MRRTLGINQTTLWCVEPIGTMENVDFDGFKTGEIIKIYSEPVKVRLHLYPSSGSIVEKLFGKDASLDMIAVTNDVELTKDTLLFLTEPTENFDRNYDYMVLMIKTSLNTSNYGLVRRT